MKRSFIVNAFLLGLALSMDAFSVAVANGLEEPRMKRSRMLFIAGVFALFQALMPVLGWYFTQLLMERFLIIERYIPYIALVLLLYLAIKMIHEGLKHKEEEMDISTSDILIQGIATSIDALSVGFTIASHSLTMVLYEVTVIGVVTFIVCLVGVGLGKAGGNRFSDKASILGGIILIAVAIKIFITGVQ